MSCTHHLTKWLFRLSMSTSFLTNFLAFSHELNFPMSLDSHSVSINIPCISSSIPSHILTISSEPPLFTLGTLLRNCCSIACFVTPRSSSTKRQPAHQTSLTACFSWHLSPHQNSLYILHVIKTPLASPHYPVTKVFRHV